MALGAVAPAAAHAAPPLIGQWPLDSSYEDGPSQVTDDASGNGLALRAPNGSVHLGAPALFGTGATLGTNQAIEKARDEANQKAPEAMQQAVAALVTGIIQGAAGATGGGGAAAAPSASTSLSGCAACRLAALASK